MHSLNCYWHMTHSLQQLHELLLFQLLQVSVIQAAFLGQLAQSGHRHVSIIQMLIRIGGFVTDFQFKIVAI